MAETMIVIFRNDDVLESQLLGLSDALLDTAHRTNLTAQSHLATHAPSLFYRCIHIAAQYGCQHTQVHRWVGYSQSARDVQEHVLRHQLEAHSLLHHSQEHVQSALVETRCRTLRSSVCRRAYQCLRLYQERADALDGGTDGNARESVVIFRKEQFRRVAHLSESSLLHLVDTQFRSTSESVFDTSQDAVHIVLVALKLDDGIHYMFQNLRSSQGSLLINMSYQDNRDATGLGKPQERRRTFPHLRYRAWRTVHFLCSNGLDRVDNYQFWSHLLNMSEYFLQLRFAENRNMVESRFRRNITSSRSSSRSPHQRLSLCQSVGTELNLMGTLLTTYIKHPSVPHVQNGLQGERTLSDARLSTQQGDAAGYHSATQHTIQFLVHHIDARFINRGDVSQLHRLGIAIRMLSSKHGGSTSMPHGHAGILSRLRSRISRDSNLLERVPLSAARAFANPFGTLLPAVAANVCNFIFSHLSQIFGKGTAFFSNHKNFSL